MSVALREGAEPFSCDRGTHGVLLLHGFTGQPFSMRPLADAFCAAGFQVELPRLPGHGTAVDDLDRYRFADWASHLEQVYAVLAARVVRVVVVGLSMGGTLACRLAERHPEIAGLILVNPFIGPVSASDMEALHRELDAGRTTFASVGSDIKREGGSGRGYDATPIRPLLSLIEGANRVREDLPSIRIPVLVFVSRNDHVVAPSTSDTIVERVRGEVERVYLENSFHVATLDYDAPELEERAIGFARKVVED